jgi:diguanylate cyclase (GGDEF)-like protein
MNDGSDATQRDALTGTATPEALLRFARAALDIAGAEGPRVALVHLDIEALQIINDRHGIGAGDAVLLEVADRLRERLRGHDLVGRFGGGFVICLPEVFPAQAQGAAERLRRAVSDQVVPTPFGTLPVACSVGLALSNGADDARAMLDRAIAAAAAAKRAGGDRVVFAA